MAALQHRSRVRLFSSIIICLAGLQSPLLAQSNLPEPTRLQTLTPVPFDDFPDPSVFPSTRFGDAVAVHGNTLLVGIPGFEGIGRVGIYKRDATGAWQRRGSIESPDGVPGGNFGTDVGFLRPNLVYVAFGSESVVPGTHLFRRTKRGEFEFARTLPVTFLVDEATGLLFTHTPTQDRSIIVRVYFLDGRLRLHKLQRFVIPEEFAFDAGTTAVWNDTFAVPVTANVLPGAVHVFERRHGVWRQTQELIASDGPQSSFGRSVAVRGHTMLVGADGADAAQTADCPFGEAGAVYVFRRRHGLWVEDQKLQPAAEPFCTTGFGQRLVFNGKLLLIESGNSAPFSEDSAWHIFERQFGQFQPIAHVIRGLDRPGPTSYDMQGEILFHGVSSEFINQEGQVSVWDIRP